MTAFSCFIAYETRAMARDIGLEPRTTPVQSPQSNGMAEAFVKTMKRDYVRVSPLPDARSVMESLPLWIDHYISLHPHKALGYRSPREFIANHWSCHWHRVRQASDRGCAAPAAETAIRPVVRVPPSRRDDRSTAALGCRLYGTVATVLSAPADQRLHSLHLILGACDARIYQG